MEMLIEKVNKQKKVTDELRLTLKEKERVLKLV